MATSARDGERFTTPYGVKAGALVRADHHERAYTMGEDAAAGEQLAIGNDGKVWRVESLPKPDVTRSSVDELFGERESIPFDEFRRWLDA